MQEAYTKQKTSKDHKDTAADVGCNVTSLYTNALSEGLFCLGAEWTGTNIISKAPTNYYFVCVVDELSDKNYTMQCKNCHYTARKTVKCTCIYMP